MSSKATKGPQWLIPVLNLLLSSVPLLGDGCDHPTQEKGWRGEINEEEGARRQRKLAHSRHVPQTATVTPEQVCRTSHCSFLEDLTSALRTPPYAFLKQTRKLSGLNTQQSTEKTLNAKPEDTRTQNHTEERRLRTSPVQNKVISRIRQILTGLKNIIDVCQTPRNFSTGAFQMVSWLIWQ